MTLARSGVIESVETTMSALLVCSIGMRVGPVVVTIARSMASRILPAFFMSSSVSACADSPSDRRAKAAPAIGRSSEAIFMARLLVQDHIRQIAAELLLVYGVQGAVLELGRN